MELLNSFTFEIQKSYEIQMKSINNRNFLKVTNHTNKEYTIDAHGAGIIKREPDYYEIFNVSKITLINKELNIFYTIEKIDEN